MTLAWPGLGWAAGGKNGARCCVVGWWMECGSLCLRRVMRSVALCFAGLWRREDVYNGFVSWRGGRAWVDGVFVDVLHRGRMAN